MSKYLSGKTERETLTIRVAGYQELITWIEESAKADNRKISDWVRLQLLKIMQKENSFPNNL